LWGGDDDWRIQIRSASSNRTLKEKRTKVGKLKFGDAGIDFSKISTRSYSVFHGFGRAKFAFGGSILGSSKFTHLPQLPLKTMLDLKVVKIDSKIIILLHLSESVTHSVPIYKRQTNETCYDYKVR